MPGAGLYRNTRSIVSYLIKKNRMLIEKIESVDLNSFGSTFIMRLVCKSKNVKHEGSWKNGSRLREQAKASLIALLEVFPSQVYFKKSFFVLAGVLASRQYFH